MQQVGAALPQHDVGIEKRKPDRRCQYQARAGNPRDAVFSVPPFSCEIDGGVSSEISTVLIEKEYPKQSPALLSLIKSSEAKLKKLI